MKSLFLNNHHNNETSEHEVSIQEDIRSDLTYATPHCVAFRAWWVTTPLADCVLWCYVLEGGLLRPILEVGVSYVTIIVLSDRRNGVELVSGRMRLYWGFLNCCFTLVIDRVDYVSSIPQLSRNQERLSLIVS